MYVSGRMSHIYIYIRIYIYIYIYIYIITQRFNMKSCSLVFDCNNKYSHSQNQTLTAAFYMAYFPV